MILEGLVTTLDADGSPHLAPMGPRVERRLRALRAAPVPHLEHVPEPAPRTARACCTSPTTRCCWRRPRSGPSTPFPPVRPAERVRGCRARRLAAGTSSSSCGRSTTRSERVTHRGGGRPRRPHARLLRLQPREARGRRGRHPRDAVAPPAARRGRGRVREAARDRRQDRRAGRARGDGPARSEAARSGGGPMIRVVAPSRLHFGLFHVPAAGEAQPGERAFGGVGLMIDSPGVVVVTAQPADSWQFEGPLASRAQAFAMRFAQSLPEADRRPFQVLVERCPAEHTGLGVGTQLGLAVAKALAVAIGRRAITRRSNSRPASAAASAPRSASTGSTAAGCSSRAGSCRARTCRRSSRTSRCRPRGGWCCSRPPAPAGGTATASARRSPRRDGGRPGRAPETRGDRDPPRRAGRRPRRVRRGGPRVQPAGRRAVRRGAGRAVRVAGRSRS